MKKNWAMRGGVTMMVLALITSCFAGGTFAKYTTGDSGNDTARAAKFGVTVTVEGKTFAQSYLGDTEEDQEKIRVESGTEESVVAPGTWGLLTKFQITGIPEVAVRVSCEATEFELGDGWKDKDGKYYCPLEITVDDGSRNATVLQGTAYSSADDFEKDVKAEIAKYSKTYEPGTDLAEQQFDDGLYVSWEWKFEGNDDAKDTFLGNQASTYTPEGTPLASVVSLSVTTTVTQID